MHVSWCASVPLTPPRDRGCCQAGCSDLLVAGVLDPGTRIGGARVGALNQLRRVALGVMGGSQARGSTVGSESYADQH